MLEVVVSWIYILIVSFPVGYALLRTLLNRTATDKTNGGKEGSFLLCPLFCILSGTGIFTLYAEIFSLFSGVSFAAQLIILITCVIIVTVFRGELSDYFRELFRNIGKGTFVAVVLLFLFFALFTSSGYMHYDSDLYHAQSIRWIEEYGIVPGLGNLHSRLAYNSAAFPLTALFSFSFLAGRSLHVMAGLYAFLLSVKILPLFRVFPAVFRKDASGTLRGSADPGIFRPSMFVRLSALYYLCSVFDEITAPSSDYFLVLFVFLLAIFWCELAEMTSGAFSGDPLSSDTAKTPGLTVSFAVLSLLTPVILSFKLSGALFVLLALYPLSGFLRKKQFKRAGLLCALMVLFTVPFLIRNVILSGYLLYPFPGLDLFSFDFKIPAGMAAYDAAEIGAYGRGLTNAASFGTPFRKWFPVWLASLGFIDRIAFVLSILCIPVLLFEFFLCFLRKKDRDCAIMILCAVTAASFAFWFLNAPLVRYGCVYLYLLPALTAGLLFGYPGSPGKCPENAVSSGVNDRRMKRSRLFGYAWAAFLSLFLLYKGVLLVRDLGTMLPRYRAHILHQQDYGDYSDVIASYTIGGLTVYYPTDGDRTGYRYFPSSPALRDDVEMRGDDVREGFRTK